jgi:hypothetical protein
MVKMTLPRNLFRLILPALLLGADGIVAAPVIPEQGGWSGQIALGAGAGSAETNMIDGIAGIGVGNDRIGSLDENASSQNFGFPLPSLDVGYTLAGTHTQLYLQYAQQGPASPVFLDIEAAGGVRQKLPDVGIIDVAVLGSAPSTKIWKDPYLTGANREDTERSISGLKIQWHNLMDSPLSLQISARDVDIDDEQSGISLGQSASDRLLLRRTGEVYGYYAQYEWQLGDRHTLVPALGYLDYQLDGDAMAQDGLNLALGYQYRGMRWQFETSIYYRDLDADKDNPIFGDAADREVLGAALGLTYPEPLGWKRWAAKARISWYDSDSDIDFYDESLGLFMLGATYRID